MERFNSILVFLFRKDTLVHMYDIAGLYTVIITGTHIIIRTFFCIDNPKPPSLLRIFLIDKDCRGYPF